MPPGSPAAPAILLEEVELDSELPEVPEPLDDASVLVCADESVCEAAPAEVELATAPLVVEEPALDPDTPALSPAPVVWTTVNSALPKLVCQQAW
jgi:hypothetical protein